MSRTTFSHLPPELVEATAKHLQHSEILNLRAASRAVNNLVASTLQFKKAFNYKSVNLGDAGELTRLIDFTEVGSPGCFLRSLTLVGPLDTTKLECQPPLLQAAFMKMSSNLQEQCLQTLELTVEKTDRFSLNGVEREYPREHKYSPGLGEGPRWPKTIGAAKAMFNLTWASLSTSSLLVNDLDIFSNVFSCALSCDTFPMVTSSPVPAAIHAKRLSLSLCDHHNDPIIYPPRPARWPQYEDPDYYLPDGPFESEECGKSNVAAVRDFFTQFPHLEALDLHYTRLGPSWDRVGFNDVHIAPLTEAMRVERQFFEIVGPNLQVANITWLSIRDILSPTSTLMDMLAKMKTLRHLSLTHMYLDEGRLDDVLALFTPTLDYLHLSNIKSPYTLIFNSPDRFCTSSRYPELGVPEITRHGDDIRSPILYFADPLLSWPFYPDCPRLHKKDACSLVY